MTRAQTVSFLNNALIPITILKKFFKQKSEDPISTFLDHSTKRVEVGVLMNYSIRNPLQRR
jgi:hypothetical protein